MSDAASLMADSTHPTRVALMGASFVFALRLVLGITPECEAASLTYCKVKGKA